MNAVIAYSRGGCTAARRVAAALGDAELYAPARLAESPFSPITPGLYGRAFRDCRALVFIGSAGIAVREIAPHLKSKATDPAVLVLDEGGNFVIPILSGHIGGANALARELAEALGATAVITTASDVLGRFSADAWASKNGYKIDSLAAVRRVSAAILEGDVPVCADFPLPGLPAGLRPGDDGELGIFIGYHKCQPFGLTLRLVPPVLRLGIGCRRGTSAEAIARAVDSVLEREGLHPAALCAAASIDLKKDEAGLLEFCKARGLPLAFYSAQELNAAEGDFTPSDFVKSVTGVDNVCERAAVVGGGMLIVKKQAGDGVTVALARKDWEVRFE